MLLRSRLTPLLTRRSRLLTQSMSSAAASKVVHTDYATLNEMISRSVEKFAERKLFGTRVGDKFEWITYKQFGREVEKFRNVLYAHKFGYNDKLGLISNNRVGEIPNSGGSYAW